MRLARLVYRRMRMASNVSTAPHPAAEAEEVYRRWLQFLDDEFVRHCSPERRAEIVRDQLYQLYLGRPHGGKLNLTLTSEHFPEVNRDLYSRRKPLLWFWQMFDRSPVGLNHWLGLRFRCMLGRHLFDHMGSGVRIHHGVDLTYGYNLSIGDGVTIRQGALLNDRGGIKIGKGAIIGSFARVYSQTYAPDNYDHATLVPTVIGDRARIASHAIVLAGHSVAPGEAVGSFPADSA